MGIQHQYSTIITFDTSIVIEGTTYSSYAFNSSNSLDMINRNDEKAQRFFKEKIFRDNGFIRCRLDGKNAIKEDQMKDEFEDFIYSPMVWSPYHSYFPTINQILNNEEIDGQKVSVMCANGIYNTAGYVDICRKLNAEIAEVERIKSKTTESIETVADESAKAKTTVAGESVAKAKRENKSEAKEEPAEAKATVVGEPVKAKAKREIKSEAKEEPAEAKATAKPSYTRTYKYEEPDFSKEPFLSNPRLVQICNDLKKDGKYLARIIPDKASELFWVMIYDQKTLEQLHNRCILLDLNGVIINNTPKFWMERHVIKAGSPEFLDYFITYTEENFNKLLNEEKFNFKDTSSDSYKLMQLNKIVDVSTIISTELINRLLFNPSTSQVITDLFNRYKARFHFVSYNTGTDLATYVADDTCWYKYQDKPTSGSNVMITVDKDGVVKLYPPTTAVA